MFYSDGTAKSKVTSLGKPVKSSLKRAGAALHHQVKPDKLSTQRTRVSSRKVLIPTAKTDDRGTGDILLVHCVTSIRYIYLLSMVKANSIAPIFNFVLGLLTNDLNQIIWL